MDYDPSIRSASTADRTSFAYVSARERWPFIITGIIDDVHIEVSKRGGAAGDNAREGDVLTTALAELKEEINHGSRLKPLEGPDQVDIKAYNEELCQRGLPSWFDVSWLFAECYLYRRINTIFNRFQSWKEYDPFARQKLSTFASSHDAVLELATTYKEVVEHIQLEASEVTSLTDRVVFQEMCEVSLWGNATDLSLLTSLSYEDIKQLQGSHAREKSRSKILINELPAVYELLADQRKRHCSRRIDIVLDNAGFELYADLAFAGYLLSAGFATQIVLHAKEIPWFVSDVIPADLDALFEALQSQKTFFQSSQLEKESTDLDFLQRHWYGFYKSGSLVITSHSFWTQAGSYWRLPSAAPDLYEAFQKSGLVIFKGDLNYRKLTGDAMWDPTTPFEVAIGPMGLESGLNILALRTCKSDVVVGLPVGLDEKLKFQHSKGLVDDARKWAWTGKWAVASFTQGRKEFRRS